MTNTKLSTVNSKGMVTIPVELRKKYHMIEGTKVAILEIASVIEIIPILDMHEVENIDHEELVKSFEDRRKIELELEK